jgi:methylthioribose-1-phosphate isomerase
MRRMTADSAKPLKNFAWDGGLENGRLVVLDQSRLPQVVRYLPLRDLEGVVTAIVDETITGASDIGVAGAYGVVLHLIPRATAAVGKGSAILGKHLEHAIGQLTSIPSAPANLGVDLVRQRACYKRHIGHLTALEMCARLLMEAKRIHREDEELKARVVAKPAAAKPAVKKPAAQKATTKIIKKK